MTYQTLTREQTNLKACGTPVWSHEYCDDGGIVVGLATVGDAAGMGIATSAYDLWKAGYRLALELDHIQSHAG